MTARHILDVPRISGLIKQEPYLSVYDKSTYSCQTANYLLLYRYTEIWPTVVMRIFLESNFTQSELDQFMALIQKFDARDPDRRIVLIMADEAQDTGQAQELLRQWGFPYQKVIGEFDT